MAAAKLFHAAGRQVTVPTYLVPATQKASCCPSPTPNPRSRALVQTLTTATPPVPWGPRASMRLPCRADCQVPIDHSRRPAMRAGHREFEQL
jgi:3-isopropylmalate/(R)-2-methylmalate dehydratase large subunit